MKTAFSVLRFDLQQSLDGSCTQDVHRCGEFDSVERAFSTAREEAIREWQEACKIQAVTTPKIRKIEIKDTEWGYDVKHDHLVVTRFWVHDGRPAEIAGL